jgi:hypothetical protein
MNEQEVPLYIIPIRFGVETGWVGTTGQVRLGFLPQGILIAETTDDGQFPIYQLINQDNEPIYYDTEEEARATIERLADRMDWHSERDFYDHLATGDLPDKQWF